MHVPAPRRLAIAIYFSLECKAMAEVKISSKNQIVIPKEARQALGVKAGDKLLAVVRGNDLLVLRKPVSHSAAIHGLGAGVYPSDYLDKERDSWE